VAEVAGQKLRHGYTNSTATDGRTVVKRYLGPDAGERQHNEVTALTAVAGLLPVPSIAAVGEGEITLSLAAGRPGQELLEDKPEPVLYEVGRLARQVAAVEVSSLAALDAAPAGTVPRTDTRERSDPQALRRAGLVHGDFGPQNLLLDEVTAEPTALLDWEFAHIGDPVEDVAWAEWIVRTHHPHLVPALPALFGGYGGEPPWRVRQESMLDKCRWLLGFARRRPDPTKAGVELWRQRLADTEAFRP
jgi:hypothetical protein